MEWKLLIAALYYALNFKGKTLRIIIIIKTLYGEPFQNAVPLFIPQKHYFSPKF